jgi:enoyl-CoA hydratase/carnithine racemase
MANDPLLVALDDELTSVPPHTGVIVGMGSMAHPCASGCDMVVDDPSDVLAAIENAPIAAIALVWLLRATEAIDVADALIVESATYSTLQAGPEHEAWLAARTRRDSATRSEAEPVLVARDGDVLHLTLNRPEVRNAYNAAMRDALLDALEIAALDPSITTVRIDGAGPNFCSGGDLDEFGTRPDPATAHIIRVTRSVGRAVHDLRERVQVILHGPCVGAGVELPAFAGKVVARPDATFRLPEVAMGLVPGAGGTVSLPRRIGRHRTAWLALTGATIDAATALDWGLVDAVDDGRSEQ